LVWIDLEMTGLDLDKCRIVEIGCIVTNKDLEIVADGPDIVIHRTEEELRAMDTVVVKMHTDSGLLKAIRESSLKESEAEMEVLEFIKPHVLAKSSPLCGNTIVLDRMFLKKYMPTLNSHLHYRNIDVSTIKELVRRWKSKDSVFKKGDTHRAVEDIKESISELKYYRDMGFIGGNI
jgi:oligoribonuclease